MSVILKNIFYVYVYLDPRKCGKYIYYNRNYDLQLTFDFEPIYIGKGQGRRMFSHTGKVKKSNKDKHDVIQEIISETGRKPIMLKIQYDMCEEGAYNFETQCIRTIGRLDLEKGPLLNLNDGGYGGGSNPSLDIRKRISESLTGRFIGSNSPNYGIKHNEEWKRNWSISRNANKIEIQKKIKELTESNLDKNELDAIITRLICDFKKIAGSIYLGVVPHYHKHGLRWDSRIVHNGKIVFIGQFYEEVHAAVAYNRRSLELFGHKSLLNDIDGWEKIEIPLNTSSQYIGVSYKKYRNKWYAYYYTQNNKQIHIGSFDTEFEAAVAYNQEVFKLYGKDAVLNNIESWQNYKLILKQTSSQYIGVHYNKEREMWESTIRYNKKFYYLGRYDTEVEAAIAYNKKAIELHDGNSLRINDINNLSTN